MRRRLYAVPFAAAWLCTAAVGGCRETTLGAPEPRPSVAQFVTGEAAAALDQNGHFRLSASTSDWTRPQLSEDQAERLAWADVRYFAPQVRGLHERVHGAPIDFSRLYRCGRAYLGESAYTEPAAGTPLHAVHHVAPRWFFTFCAPGDVPVMSEAIATTAVGATFNEIGVPNAGSLSGGEIAPMAIPRGTQIPVSPEFAVERVARASGRRIQAVPILVLPGSAFMPQSARWQLVLEGNARTRGVDGESHETVLFFGRSSEDGRPTAYRGRARRASDVPDAITSGTGEVIQFLRRSQYPGAFTSVSVEANP